MVDKIPDLSRREARLGTRLLARGNGGLFDCLVRLRGHDIGAGLAFTRIHAVGGEGALFVVRDAANPDARLVGKIPVVPWDRPIRLSSGVLRARRSIIEWEAEMLESAGSPFFPRFHSLLHFANPLLEAARGGAFANPEPCLVMERLGGHDMDAWLCRIHRGGLRRKVLRPVLDRIVVGVVQGLTDLERRGFLYADLRPGNLRVIGRPLRRTRLLDAGGCVRADDPDARFPHVPSYLPPRVYRAVERGEKVVPTSAIQASMAGRTLYEVATGQVPKAASYVDMMRLVRSPVSPPVAEEIAALANENHPNCAAALEALGRRAKRREPGVKRPGGLR